MNHTNGTDKMRLAQLMALAENLYLLATRYRENGNYVVAHALYGRALEIAQLVDGPEQNKTEVRCFQKSRTTDKRSWRCFV